MKNGSANVTKKTILSIAFFAIGVIFVLVALLANHELDYGTYVASAISLLISAATAYGGKDKNRVLFFLSVALFAVLLVSFIYSCANKSPNDDDSAETDAYDDVELEGSNDDSALKDNDESNQENPPSNPVRNGGYISPADLDKELEIDNNYLPTLEENEEKHLFLITYHMVFQSSSPNAQYESVCENVANRYNTYLHEKENYPAHKVNGDKELSELILSAEIYDNEVREKISTYDSPVEAYERLIQIYEEVCDKAARGEYFLQLARPYSEILLYLPRETSAEKDYVFSCGSRAVHAYLETMTYQGDPASSDADILYRTAAVYHTLGDTIGLDKDKRIEMYQLAAAFLHLADNMMSESDRYYGYSTYYYAMVMHKLAIVSEDSTERHFFLNHAKDLYEQSTAIAENHSGVFSEATLDDIVSALEDVRYRLSYV